MAKTRQKPRIAIIHDYLTQYGGAEKTLESILEIFPNSPIFTSIYDNKILSEAINSQKIICPRNPLLKFFPKYLTFLMPVIFENFDLRNYDLILSDGTAWAKGVLTTPEQLHISYIHTPPRFLYKYSVESQKRDKWYFKPIIPLLDHILRTWDFNAAQRPDYLLTNSKETQKRIQKFYRRASKVIYPPVELNIQSKMSITRNIEPPYYIALGRLAAYKNFDLIVESFNILGLPIKIVGTGKEEKRLKKAAGSNITFTGRVNEGTKHNLLENSLGLIFPVQDEDFGIVPIEAMSHGKPVFAHRSGGVLETIQENINGSFFDEIEIDDFIKKMKEFDRKVRAKEFDSNKIKESVQKFSKDRFKEEYAKFVLEKWEEHARTTRNTYNSNGPKK